MLRYFIFCFFAQPAILRECLGGLQLAYIMWMYVLCACSNIAHMAFMWFFPHHRCLFVAIAVALLIPPKRTNQKPNVRSKSEINSFGTQFYQLSISVDLKIIPKAINMEYDKSPIKYKTRQITAKVIYEKHELQYIKKINHWIRCRFSGTKKKQPHWTFAHIIFIHLKYSKVKLFTWINSWQ